MTDIDTRRADADLRHDVAALLHRLGDAVQAGQFHRWQLITALGPLQQLARLLRVGPVVEDIDTRRAETADAPECPPFAQKCP